MNIKGKRVTLRAMEKSDCPLIVEMFNDPEMENLVVGWSFPLAEFAQEKWLENHCGDQTNLRFVIEDEKKQKVNGAVDLVPEIPESAPLEIGLFHRSHLSPSTSSE